MRKHVTNRTWSEEDTEKFKVLFAEGVSLERMSVIFKRTTNAVKQKARELGTPFPKRVRYSPSRHHEHYTGGFYRP